MNIKKKVRFKKMLYVYFYFYTYYSSTDNGQNNCKIHMYMQTFI